MTPGTYTLLIELAEPASIEFGAQGVFGLDAGWYAYTGSAFGAGGLGRVDRHRDLAAGERDARHWHVDYLLGHDASSVETVYVTENEDVECETARALTDAGEAFGGLGASDCDCETHLVYGSKQQRLAGVASAAHSRSLDGDPLRG